jgi:pilus assembly protein Flp/PilA
MTKLLSIARSLHNDEDGAAFIEYTVLLGILLAGAVGFIVTVGGKTTATWTTMSNLTF